MWDTWVFCTQCLAPPQIHLCLGSLKSARRENHAFSIAVKTNVRKKWKVWGMGLNYHWKQHTKYPKKISKISKNIHSFQSLLKLNYRWARKRKGFTQNSSQKQSELKLNFTWNVSCVLPSFSPSPLLSLPAFFPTFLLSFLTSFLHFAFLFIWVWGLNPETYMPLFSLQNNIILFLYQMLRIQKVLKHSHIYQQPNLILFILCSYKPWAVGFAIG